MSLERRGYLEPEAEKLKAELTLRLQAQQAGGAPLEEARAALAAKPDDLKLKFQLAESLAAAGQYSDALALCLELVERDRQKEDRRTGPPDHAGDLPDLAAGVGARHGDAAAIVVRVDGLSFRRRQYASACRPARGSPAVLQLAGGGVEADHAGRGAQGSGVDAQDMAAGFQGFEDVAADVGVDSQPAQCRRSLAERVDEMIGHETRGDDRRGRLEAEIDVIEQELEGHLVLVVAAGDADGQNGPASLEHEGRREGDPRALAGGDDVGVVIPGVEALEAAAEPDAGIAGDDSGPAAGGGGDDVAEAVGDQAGGRVAGVGEGRRQVPLRGVGRAGSSTGLSERGSPGRRSSEAWLGSISPRRIAAYSGLSRAASGTSAK